MISLLLKNWKFILDAVLIIALIVLLFLWNPFGIFGDGLSFGTTTNMVTEVRHIGQLVTAEYYGEVISSIDESRMALIDENNTQQRANQRYSDIKHALHDLYQYQQLPKEERTREFRENRDLFPDIPRWRRVVQHDVSRRNIDEKLLFHNLLPERDALYQQVVEFLWREKLGHGEDEDWNPNDRQADEVLFSLYTELAERHTRSTPAAFQAYLNDGFEFSADFNAFVNADQVSELSRAERKKKLAMVGRGWVKAGFDFGTLDEHSYYFDEVSGELHFFGLEPQILNADINPWFIPERGIPGFEIIDYQGSVSFRDAQKVKQHCLDKLLLYAHQADIIGNAQRQGAETLKSFFTLLTGQEVTQVHFHNDILTQTANAISRDEYINYYEGTLVDSLLRRERAAIDSLRRTVTNRTRNQQLANERDSLQKKVLQRLRQLPFESSPVPFNYYSVMAYRMGLDSIVDQHERRELLQRRWDLTENREYNLKRLSKYKNPRYWFEDSLALLMEYNVALDYLQDLPATVADTGRVRLPNTETEEWLDTAHVQVLTYTIALDTSSITYLDSLTMDSTSFLTTLRYPFHYAPHTFARNTRTDTLFVSETLFAADTTLSRDTPGVFWIYNTTANVLTRVAMPPSEFLDDRVLPPGRTSIVLDSTLLLINADSIPLSQALRAAYTFPDTAQAEALGIYYRILEQAQWQQQDKGAIVRASEWVRRRLSQPQDSVSAAAQIREFLFP